MDIMIKTLIEQGVLIVIAIVFFSQYKEDRTESKKERDDNKELTKKVIILTGELSELVEGNKSVIEESIVAKEEMIESLKYSKDSHQKIETDLAEIKSDLNMLKNTSDEKVIPILERVESKVDSLGKSEGNTK